MYKLNRTFSSPTSQCFSCVRCQVPLGCPCSCPPSCRGAAGRCWALLGHGPGCVPVPSHGHRGLPLSPPLLPPPAGAQQWLCPRPWDELLHSSCSGQGSATAHLLSGVKPAEVPSSAPSPAGSAAVQFLLPSSST